MGSDPDAAADPSNATGIEEPDPIPLSALQHWAYCHRQCGLIHLDQAWGENLYTLRGRRVHEQVDAPGGETVYGVRVERGLPMWSDVRSAKAEGHVETEPIKIPPAMRGCDDENIIDCCSIGRGHRICSCAESGPRQQE